MAVAAIVTAIATRPITGRRPAGDRPSANPRTLTGRLRTLAIAQIAVTVGLAPVTLSVFAEQSLVSPFVNALAIPLVGAIVVPVILAGLAGGVLFPPVGAVMLAAAALLLDTLWPAVEWVGAHAVMLRAPGHVGWWQIAAADAARHHDRHPLPGMVKLRLVDCLLRCGNGQLRETIHSARVLPRHVLRRLEALHLPRYLRFQILGVERCDAIDAGHSPQEAMPCGVPRQPYWTDDPDTSDDRARCHSSWTLRRRVLCVLILPPHPVARSNLPLTIPDNPSKENHWRSIRSPHFWNRMIRSRGNSTSHPSQDAIHWNVREL